jgi:predicted ATPase
MEQPGYQYRLLDFKFNDGTVLHPDKLTVFVGPNNSGKSRSLKEIAALTCQPQASRGVLVSAVNVNYPSTLEEFRQVYDVERHLDENGNWSFRTLAPDLIQEYQTSSGIWPTAYEQQFRSKPERFSSYFAEQFGRAMVAFLTTESRLQLVREGPSPSHYRQSSSLLQHLYNSGTNAERVVSDLVMQTFGKAVALDFTIPQTLLLRVGDDLSGLPADPRDARPLMQEKEKLDDQGDGIRSFVGIIIALLTLKRGLFLIDEPEAFLHPPQAFRVGTLIADQSNQSRQITPM